MSRNYPHDKHAVKDRIGRAETHPRIQREMKTVWAMIRIFCAGQHQPKAAPCDDCCVLLDYALARLEKCPFHENKSTCANCSIHCYKPEMRERIRLVMRYAGPKMILRHPVLAVYHLLEGRRDAAHTSPPNSEIV